MGRDEVSKITSVTPLSMGEIAYVPPGVRYVQEGFFESVQVLTSSQQRKRTAKLDL